EDAWFPLRLLTALTEAIWEESESSSYSIDRLGGIFTYCCSLYGVTCMAMSVILNRTLVMASSNSSRNQQLAMNRNRGLMNSPELAEAMKRLSIISFRIGVIAILLYNGYNILTALNLHGHVGISGPSVPFLYKLLPDSLFAYDAEYFSSTNYMKSPSGQVMVGPTTDMYWPIFLSFCLLLFTETFVSVVQGKRPYTESGITIFEHSLVFQEFSSAGAALFGRSKYYRRPNEQVLVLALFLVLTHLNIHIGGLIDDNKHRLIPLTILGVSFLSYYICSIFKAKIFGFPAMLNIILMPQVLVVFVICVSALIFVIAIVAHGFRIQELNLASFFKETDEEDTNIFQDRLQDDFYTVLLDFGMVAITLAGASSYITELSLVAVDDRTWLERGNYKEAREALQISEQSNQFNLDKDTAKGYSNMISQPSKSLVSGSEVDESGIKESVSVFKKRNRQLSAIILSLVQLLYGVTKSVLIKGFPNFIRKFILRAQVEEVIVNDDETEAEFEARKSRVPEFLRKHMVRRTKAQIDLDKQKLVEIDEFSEESIADNYLNLLNGMAISEIDNSENYLGMESDLDSDYSESESVTEIVRTSERIPTTIGLSEVGAFSELITADDLTDMITTDTDVLRSHMKHDYSKGMLTRSKFAELVSVRQSHQTDMDETHKLLEVIASTRHSAPKPDNDSELLMRLDCVICQVNMREIITWPCKCFAICEPCRLRLAAKGIEGCVCCRRDVQGVSKVFIP
ncbi:uncharacterized protein CANTADRAFT_34443, partial [Suhomyces tanzawaensis NRRL Y-17324]